MLFFPIIPVTLVTVVIHGCIAAQIYLPSNPCPDIFSYHQENGLYFGIIKLPYDGFSKELVISLNATIIGQYNNLGLDLKLITPINSITINGEVSYRVVFPLQHVLPKITKIQMNNRIYCMEPAPEKYGHEGYTTLWATVTLPLDNNDETIPLQQYFFTNNNLQTAESFNPNRNPFLSHTQQPQTSSNPFLALNQKLPSNPFLTNHQSLTNPFLTPTKRPTAPPIDSTSTTVSPTTTQVITTTKTTPNQAASFSNNPFLSSLITIKPALPKVNNTDDKITQVSNKDDGSTETTMPHADICGIPVGVNQLIVHGESINRGDFPWLTAIFHKNKYICSSTLITNNHVITAAHCLYDRNRLIKPEQLLFVFGRVDVAILDTIDGAVNIIGDKLHVHPNYEPKNPNADIAIVSLERPVIFTDFIRPVCLWIDFMDSDSIVGTYGTVAGWGLNEDGNNDLSEARKVDIPVVSREECRNSDSAFHNLVTPNIFCAGTRDGRGPCNGDSGSGFVMLRNSKWYLRGIVSLSKRKDDLISSLQCDLDHYVLYTDACRYTSWILNILN